MTDPVILLGTQSNGETLPVQVNSFGQLVAEGLQGPEGPEGPTGGEFPLPPNPYEGAFLGWLNGDLAWIGKYVPIPEGVFGPILAWDSEVGLLTLGGDIPAEVGSGVFVWQCEQDGTYFTNGWNVSEEWSAGTVTTIGNVKPNQLWGNMFNGDLGNWTSASSDAANARATLALPSLGWVQKVEVYPLSNPPGAQQIRINDTNIGPTTVHQGWQNITGYLSSNGISSINSISIGDTKGYSATQLNYAAIRIDGQLLVDRSSSLNLRVTQKASDTLIGSVNTEGVDFTIGKYLRVPEQRVAPWVLYGNDPTSHIDQLRSL